MSQSRGVTAGTVLVITSTSLLPYSVSLSTALAGRLQVLHMETSREDQRNVEATHVEHREIPADLAGLEAKGQRLMCVPQAIRRYAAADGMQRMQRLVSPCVCEHPYL